MPTHTRILSALAGWLVVLSSVCPPTSAAPLGVYGQARRNGEQAAEVLERCHRFVEGWLNQADEKTGLIPQNLRSAPAWTPENSAADLWPFMVLACYWTDQDMLQGRMREILESEIEHTSRVGALPDAFDFTKQAFAREQVDHGRLIFGASEYCKDGLLPIAELMGPGPYFDRLRSIAADICAQSKTETDFGPIPSDNAEVNGEMLQVLSRLYFATKDRTFRDTAFRIADAYFLEVLPNNNWLPCHRWDFQAHEPRDDRLRLIDHGSEIVGGLSEAFVLARYADRDRFAQYREPMGKMIDTLIEHALNPEGLWCLELRTRELKVTNAKIPDTWGYVHNAVYTYGMVTNQSAYYEHVRRGLESIHHHPEWGGADAFSDCIEGALVLLNRISVDSAWQWADEAIARMSAKQREDGVIEGWHGDGNVARTWLMYAMAKSGGVRAEPWRPDVRLGAVTEDTVLHGTILYLRLTADEPW
ncbi:MAG: hypothetical protein ACE5R4_10665, partial [Armatimonadota bacterium]